MRIHFSLFVVQSSPLFVPAGVYAVISTHICKGFGIDEVVVNEANSTLFLAKHLDYTTHTYASSLERSIAFLTKDHK